MKQRKILWLIVLVLIFLPNSAQAEKASLKLSFNLSFYQEGDLNKWIESFNLLYKDLGALKGAQPTGGFESPRLGSLYEIELRFPLDLGFALNLSGSSFSANKEGKIDLSYRENNIDENLSGTVMNRVSAVPLKIGLSFSYPFPWAKNLHLMAQVGRQIVFARYKTQQIYDEVFRSGGDEFAYTLDRNDSYNSEGLGFYASLGAEYDLPTFISVVFEIEKVWCTVDSFKGSYTLTKIEKNPYGETQDIQEDKASLYFYESNEWELGNYYLVLSGHNARPENPVYREIRGAEFDFNGLVFKIGIRFKF